jgi:hypothetical protein
MLPVRLPLTKAIGVISEPIGGLHRRDPCVLWTQYRLLRDSVQEMANEAFVFADDIRIRN